MSERFLYTIWNRLPFRFRQRLKQNVKRNMQEQYAESEQELYRRTEQFLLKQGKIILIEVMIGGLLLAVVLAWHIFKPDYILLKRNPFGQGTKEVQISLQKGNKKKQIQYKLEEQKISLKERQKVYQAFFKQLKKEMRGRNPSLYKVSEALNLPESIAGYPFEITYELPEDGSVHLDGTLSEEVQTQLHKGERYSRYIIFKKIGGVAMCFSVVKRRFTKRCEKKDVPAGRNRLRMILASQDGMGVVEVILIIVVLIGLVIIFQTNIKGVVASIFSTIQKNAGSVR